MKRGGLTPGDWRQVRALLREELILLRRLRRHRAFLDAIEAIGLDEPQWLIRAVTNDGEALADVDRRFDHYAAKRIQK